MLAKVFSVALLATSVLADGASILAAMARISADSAELNATVSEWNGGILGVLPITIQSTTLLNDIKNGTAVAQASANLTLIQAIQVAQATQTLAKGVNSSLETIIAAKTKFDHLLLSPVILLSLQLQKDASADFSAAVISKVPANLQGAAQVLVGQIQDSFAKAIGIYNPFPWPI
jgi:hypothetical protein